MRSIPCCKLETKEMFQVSPLFSPTNIILFTELLTQTVKNLKLQTKCLKNKQSEDVISYGEVFWQHAVKLHEFCYSRTSAKA